MVLLAALAACYRSGASDYWFHLGAGRAIHERGFPAREMWCLAAVRQAPFYAGWAYQLPLYELHRLAGELGVALWRAGWAALAAGLAALLLRAVGAASWAALGLGLLVLAASRDALRVRPEQMLLALLLFALLELERGRRGRDRTRWLVPAQALWANAHPAWLIGPALAWIYSIAEWWQESATPPAAAAPVEGAPSAPAVPAPPPAEAAAPPAAPAPPPAPPRSSRSRNWMILGLVLWVASALTPTPLVTLATPFRFLFPLHLDGLAAPLGWLHRWSWSADRFDPFTALALLWLVAMLLGGARAWRASPALCVVSLLMLALGFYSAQFRDLAAWAAWAPLALALAPGGATTLSWLRGGFAAAAALAGLLWLAVPDARFPLGTAPRTESMPVRAVALADSAGLSGIVLNLPESGGYILAARGPGHPPLIDPRLRGPDDFHEHLREAQVAPLGLEILMGNWPFTHAIVPLPRGDDRLATNLSQRLEWALVSYDDGGCLYVRWRDQPALSHGAYRYLTPDVVAMTQMIASSVSDSGLARRLESELLRARAASPLHARADEWLGELALAHARAPEAVRWLEEANHIAPDTPRLQMALGHAYDRVGERAKARAAYQRALRGGDESGEAQRMLNGGL